MIAGKYKVQRVLGAGGMGIVVEALHLSLEEKVAIKFLKPEALENAASVARFAREARASARIKSEHVCKVADVLVEDGVPYLVMEYLEGKDLDELVRTNGPLRVEDGVDYVLQACEALAEAHMAGIVHRDLKPANLFLSRRADGSPCVKVLDFGISKVQPKAGSQDAAMTATSSLLGSPLYMSPEQMKAVKEVDARTDVWSVGVILYEILTGDRPFVGDTVPAICAQILSEPPIPLAGRVPPMLEAAILKCLEKRPEDRFQNVAELAEALRDVAPASSALSIDRVSRVIGGHRSGNVTAPNRLREASASSSTGPRAAPAGHWSDATVEAPGVAPTPLAMPARTSGSVGGTHAAFESRVNDRSPRKGRLPLFGAIAAAVGFVGLVGFVGAKQLRSSGGSRPDTRAPLITPAPVIPASPSIPAVPEVSVTDPSIAPAPPPSAPAIPAPPTLAGAPPLPVVPAIASAPAAPPPPTPPPSGKPRVTPPRPGVATPKPPSPATPKADFGGRD